MSESSRTIQKPLRDRSLRGLARLAVAGVGLTAAIAWGSANLGPAMGATVPARPPIPAPISALSARNLAVRDQAPASEIGVRDADDDDAASGAICRAPTSGTTALRAV